MRAARQAGTKQAASATARKSALTAIRLGTSLGLVWTTSTGGSV
jgi:hypothetical protein